jgi:hypothetical protein
MGCHKAMERIIYFILSYFIVAFTDGLITTGGRLHAHIVTKIHVLSECSYHESYEENNSFHLILLHCIILLFYFIVAFTDGLMTTDGRLQAAHSADVSLDPGTGKLALVLTCGVFTFTHPQPFPVEWAVSGIYTKIVECLIVFCVESIVS